MNSRQRRKLRRAVQRLADQASIKVLITDILALSFRHQMRIKAWKRRGGKPWSFKSMHELGETRAFRQQLHTSIRHTARIDAEWRASQKEEPKVEGALLEEYVPEKPIEKES